MVAPGYTKTPKDAVISVQNLSWRYVGTQRWALEDVSFQVHAGEIIGIVGPSGAGKTTLTLALRGLIPHNFQGVMKGSVRICGFNTKETHPSRLVGRVGVVFQDPETQFTGLSVEEEIVFALENLGLSDEEMDRRIADALEAVQLPAAMRNRSPFQLSGGQKQRVVLAAVLAMEPDVIILDEPTSELDPVGEEEIFKVLVDLRRRRNVTVVIVSHATEQLATLCDRILCVGEGRLIKDSSTREFFSAVKDLYSYGIRPPQVTELAYELAERTDGTTQVELPLSIDEACWFLSRLEGKGLVL